MSNHPCMHVRCEKEAQYAVECLDGFNTTVCEDHIEFTKEQSYYKAAHKLDEN